MDQCATGFPITGKLSRNRVFDFKQPKNPLVGQSHLFSSAESRFRERPAKSGTKNALLLLEETLRHVHRGWMCKPVPLAESGKPEGFPPNGFNVAFRFGVEQASKLRACDDLRHSLANQACLIATPIQLVSRAHLAQLCKRSCGDGRDWALFKADHEAAYKKLPLAQADQRKAVIVLRRPTSGKRPGFLSRALMFGATAAVLRYNVFRS